MEKSVCMIFAIGLAAVLSACGASNQANSADANRETEQQTAAAEESTAEERAEAETETESEETGTGENTAERRRKMQPLAGKRQFRSRLEIRFWKASFMIRLWRVRFGNISL